MNPLISEYNEKIAQIESNLDYLEGEHAGNEECSALLEDIRTNIETLKITHRK